MIHALRKRSSLNGIFDSIPRVKMAWLTSYSSMLTSSGLMSSSLARATFMMFLHLQGKNTGTTLELVRDSRGASQKRGGELCSLAMNHTLLPKTKRKTLSGATHLTPLLHQSNYDAQNRGERNQFAYEYGSRLSLKRAVCSGDVRGCVVRQKPFGVQTGTCWVTQQSETVTA